VIFKLLSNMQDADLTQGFK